MHGNIASHPTHIAELVPLGPVTEGHHDASGSGAGAGDIWFPSATLVSCLEYHVLKPLFGITRGLTTSSSNLSWRTNQMALSPTLIWSLLEDCCTWRLSPRPSTSPNVLSHQKRITSAPHSGSKKVVPLERSLLLLSCCSSEVTNVSTITSHGLTTFQEPPTTLLVHSPIFFTLLGIS